MPKPKLYTIKELSEDERPREKLIKQGARLLSNAELLAILIRTGTENYNAIDVARNLLKEANNSLNELARFDLDQYKKVSGLGMAKAVSIMAALELGNRRILEDAPDRFTFTESKDVYQYFRSLFADSKTEQAWFVTLNRANKLIRHYQLSSGGQASTVIDIRIILKQALYDDASAIILAHNHPSGNLTPSEQDKAITLKLTDAARLLDIRFLDHLIITQHGYFSFSDNNLMG